MVAGISAIIPVYNGQDSLSDLVNRLQTVLADLEIEYELLMVNDGSADRSWNVIGDLASQHGWIRGINLMRNYGQHNALLINDPDFIEQAEIIREKGTNRSKIFRGEVDKYSWIEFESSYLPSDINAAFLWAQMEKADSINRKRLRMWDWYHEAFAELENRGSVRRPFIPGDCGHNAHMYYLLLPDI